MRSRLGQRGLFRQHFEPAQDGLDVGALAPMVDMMTLLLVFLLRTWSTESAPAPPTGAFALASTTSSDTRAAAITILVSEEAIWVEGHRVTATPSVVGDVVIRQVYDPLLMLREKGRVEIHSDARVSYGVLKRVIATCQAAGVSEVALVGASAEGM